MSLIILIFIGIANVIGAFLVYYTYGKSYDKEKKIKYTLIAIGAVCIVTQLIYMLSGLGVGSFQNSKTVKNYIMIAFTPVNVIAILPFSIYSFIQNKEKKIKTSDLNKRLILVQFIAIVLIVGEFIYFRNYQKNMKKIVDEVQEAQNSIETNNTIDNSIQNSIVENVITDNNIIQN